MPKPAEPAAHPRHTRPFGVFLIHSLFIFGCYTINMSQMGFKHLLTFEPKGLQPKKCDCEHQLCKGLFIPSRVGQERCLFDLSERGVLDNFPLIKDDTWNGTDLVLFCIHSVLYYENSYDDFSLEEMVD